MVGGVACDGCGGVVDGDGLGLSGEAGALGALVNHGRVERP